MLRLLSKVKFFANLSKAKNNQKVLQLFKGLKLGKKNKHPKKMGVDFKSLPTLLTINQVSKIFDIHPNTLRNWDKSEKLKAIRIGVRKDRRYEKETVEKLYLEIQPSPKKQIETTKEEVVEDMPEPEVSKYVIQPGWSWKKIKLLLISKKFSVFVYSVSLVAFAFLTIQVTFFTYIFMAQADEKSYEIYNLILEPSEVSGWEGAARAIKIDILATAPLADFSSKNSAVYNNIPVVSEKLTTEPVSAVVEESLTESGDETISETVSDTGMIEETPVAEEKAITEEPAKENSPASNTNAESANANINIENANTNTTLETTEELAPVPAEGAVLGEEITIEDTESFSEVGSVFEARGFMLPDSVSEDMIIKETYVVFSFAADSYDGNEDVITFAYSVDGSTTWKTLESTALFTDISNATNNGYWKYPILALSDKEAVEDFAVRVTYHPVPAQESSTAYLDGVELEFLMIESNNTIKDIHESVEIKKKDVTASENPVIEINTKDKGFLGINTKKRTIKDFNITDADGNEIKASYNLIETEKKDKIISGYEIDTKSLEKPGKYNVTMEIEQDGQIEKIKKEFNWGMLVLNTDQSVYKTGQPAMFSLGAFDEYGGIICDANLELMITDPEGYITTLSSENGGIETSENCLLKNVAYEQADYQVSYIPGVAGSYSAELKTTYQGSTQSIHRNFSAEIAPSLMVKRYGPTRVNPNEYHTMSLEIVSDNDFRGEIRERVPDGFKYAGSEATDCFLEYIKDSAGEATGYMEIVCTMDIKRGMSNFITYYFLPLRPETSYFDFGPTVIKSANTDFNSGHTWDVFLKEGKIEQEILDKIKAGESPNIITKLRTAEKTVAISQNDFSQEKKTGEYTSGVVTSQGLDQLIASADVESISVDQPVSVLLEEAIPLIRALPEDRSDGQTGAGKKICIVDTGIDYNHPAITNYKGGYDFVNNDDDPFDDHGHGTHVAGVVSSLASGSEIYMAKVIDEQGIGYESTVLSGLQWCIDQNVDVINFSI
ncbi:MAG: S8 family serine peptidase, partial [candidate division Zixibacteria bacterium]|nr:S8 family serine peptidase [candidate division Zixibacteria bacterium]